MDDYESVLLILPEVFMYKIPPRATNRSYRANEWNLDNPDWSGRLRLASVGNKCVIKLEDKNSGELFAKAPIDEYPGPAIEAVSDSSRYFVLRIIDDSAGRTAFIGVGFADRSNAFDLNVTLQDHFKRLKVEQDIEKEKDAPKPALDLGFKEGEKISIPTKCFKKRDQKDGNDGPSKPKTKIGGGGMGILLPPPPAAGPKVSPSASLNISREATPTSSPSHQPNPASSGASGGEAASNSSWVQF
ncbi:NECAP-like protein CG9132 [Folsomia candida]|uniref:Adaptin ear-binding coat-associated protein 1 n=1 Tax=Folsomia candida TaxID=158441 RepID=A0A226ELB5_FOLCA|nr:NECAP-like protein CG9132 [Folsomia candida]XP_021948558.1 NECAP-like protein CG9132 [Folsomia candida]XP_021948559.1 NECAP-like protein CG9132 [Folsomia candida]OXA58485.1 Adaptin ear-binding coat-associated protein 1 [Folsomia candida]